MSIELVSEHATVLEALHEEDRPISIDELAMRLSLQEEAVAGAAFALEEQGLARVEHTSHTDVRLTEEGEDYADAGLPELRLLEAAKTVSEEDPVGLDIIFGELDLDGELIDIALSNLARKGYGDIEEGELHLRAPTDPDPEQAILERLADDDPIDDLLGSALDALVRRGLVEREDRTHRQVVLTDDGRAVLVSDIEVTERIGQLTPALLTSGEWRDGSFSEYNVEADPAMEIGGSEHPLRRMAERVKDVLIGMGFQEMEGPHVDADFWINDCLFMPQDHPARTHWDRFQLERPEAVESLPPDLVEAVKDAHRHGVGEHGEGYNADWEESFASELALRGHTTSLTVRHLAGQAQRDIEAPARFFSVEKAYRNDTIDATHLLEFFQIEGWVMAESLSVRDLMGTFTEFYEHFGITDLEFKPHYNPYTEPSFELFGTHPQTGELIEIGNSGIFRPEMLEPLGVDHDVMAWGLALERLMMLVTGAKDIRDVHGTLADLEFLRESEVVY